MNWNRLGVYFWGTLFIVLSAVALAGIFFANPVVQNGLYSRIKDSGEVLGPLIASAALAWSWFYNVDNKV